MSAFDVFERANATVTSTPNATSVQAPQVAPPVRTGAIGVFDRANQGKALPVDTRVYQPNMAERAVGAVGNFAKNVGQSTVSTVASAPGDIIFGQAAQGNEISASYDENDARRLLGFSEYKLYGTAPKDAKSIAELDQRLPNWRNYEKSRYLPPEEVKRLKELGFKLYETRRQGAAEYKEGMNRVKPESFTESEIAKDREDARLLQERASQLYASAEILRGAQAGTTEDLTPEWAKLDPNDMSRSARYGRYAGAGVGSLLTAAAAGPTAGSVVLGMLESQGTYQQAISEGLSPSDAAPRVAQAFIWSIASEYPQLEFMKEGPGLVRGAVRGLSEVPQEMVQQLGLNIINDRPLTTDMEGSIIGALAAGPTVGAIQGHMNARGEGAVVNNDVNSIGYKTSEWIRNNKDALYDLSEHKNPTSRKTFEELGLPRMSQDDRTTLVEISRTLSSLRRLEQEKAAEARKKNPNDTLPLDAETQARVDKVREEVAAQDAVVEGSGINEAVVAPVVEPPKKTTIEERKARLLAKVKADKEANAPKPAKTEPSVVPVASEPVVAPEVVPEPAKPVEDAVAAEAKAVKERKKGKRVPKAPNPVNKGKGVVEPVAEVETKTVKVGNREFSQSELDEIRAKRELSNAEESVGIAIYTRIGGNNHSKKQKMVREAKAKMLALGSEQEARDFAKGMYDKSASERSVKAAEDGAALLWNRANPKPPVVAPPPVADVAAKEQSEEAITKVKKQGKKVKPVAKESSATDKAKDQGVIDEDVNSITLKMNDGNTIYFKKTSRVVSHSKGRVIQEIEGTTKDGKFVGARFLVNKDTGTLTIVGFASEAKGNGYGTQLLNSIKDEARKNGITKIVADDTRTNDSLKYWEKQGFKSDGGINAILEMSPAPSPATERKQGKKVASPHTAIYNGTEVEVADFKQASMRVSDNLKAGEHGYVKTPDGKLYEIVRDKKTATLVPEMRTKNAREIAELETRITKAKSDNERTVLTKRLEDLKAKPPAPAPVKVETAPVLDSKGRSPEQLARMTANARAFKEASAKEGALPKPKPNPALASSVAKAKAEGNDIELVDTVSDLPSDIRAMLPTDTSNIEGFYVNGKTYIIGENVTADRAEAVVREEMAHRKLDTAQGEELIDGFKKRMTEKDRKALIKEGYTKTRGESDTDYESRLADEFIAKQARKNTSAWTEFVDSVKSFLESVGVRDLTSEEAARVILRKLRGGVATGKGVRYSLSENVWNTPQQKISSANTSINSSQLPASFKKISWVSGTRNADIGGGRFDNATEYLDDLGVENVIYDPFNRSQEHNDAAVSKISNGNSDTATVNNVLNVIAESPARESVIKQAANAIREDGVAYFLIYQGNESGIGTPTKAGWQENRKADSYTDEIAKHFEKVTRQGNMLVASQPKNGGNDIRYSLREQDAAYMDAVNSGDMATAQKMVDEAAKRAGYTSEGWHGTRVKWWEFLRGTISLTIKENRNYDPEQRALNYALGEGGGRPSIDVLNDPSAYIETEDGDKYRYNKERNEFVYGNNVLSFSEVDHLLRQWMASKGTDDARVLHLYVRAGSTLDATTEQGANLLRTLAQETRANTPSEAKALQMLSGDGDQWSSSKYFAKELQQILYPALKRLGYDSLKIKDDSHLTLQIFDSSAIKSADPVTRDDSGRVIPLSERFNEKSNDIRFSLAPSTEQEQSEYTRQRSYFQAELDDGATIDELQDIVDSAEDEVLSRNLERFIEENEHAKAPEIMGVSRAMITPEREALGQTSPTAGEVHTHEAALEVAKATLERNGSAGTELVDSLWDKPRPLDEYEVALLVAIHPSIRLAYDDAVASGDKARITASLERLNKFYHVVESGADRSKTITARALSAMQMTVNQKLELQNMTQEIRGITGEVVEPGTETYDTLKRISEDFKSRTAMLEKETERLQAENEVLLKSIRSQVNQVIYDENAGIEKALIGKKNAKRKKVSTAAKTFSEKTSSLGDRLIEEAMASMNLRRARVSAGVDPMVLVDLSKLGAGYMLKGMSNISERIAQAYGAEISDADMQTIIDKAEKLRDKEKARLLSESKVEMEPVEEGVTLQDLDLKAIFKEQADQGVELFEDALKNVGEEVREAGLDVTDEQIRDEFDGYNKEPRQLSDKDSDRIMSQYRQVAQLCSKIDVILKQGKKPHNIGDPRFPMGQEARESKKKLNSLMKELDAKLKELGLYEGGPTDLKSAIDSAKTRMQNEIDDKKKAMAENKRIVKNAKGIDFSNDPKAIQLRAELDQVNKDYAEAFPKEPLTPEQTLEVLTKQAERNASYWNKRVQDAKSGKFKSTDKVAKPTNAVIEQLKLEAEMSKDEVTRLYDLKYPSQRAIDAIRRRDEAAIKAMKRMIETKNFSKPRARQADISGDARAMAAHIAREQIKKEYDIIKAKVLWEKMDGSERDKEILKDIYSMPKTLLYSGDISFQGRQGATAGFMQPRLWLEVGIKGTKGLNEKQAAKMIQEIKESDNYRNGIYDEMGLAIDVSDPTGNFSWADDARLQSRIIDHVPIARNIIKVSGRDWGTRANLMRTGLANIILSSSEYGREIMANSTKLDEKQKKFLKNIGWGVNMFTGHSNMKGRGTSFLLGAPNWLLSVYGTIFQAPVIRAARNHDFKAAIQLEKQYARAYGVIAAIYALCYALPGGPDDDKRNKAVWDPRSDDWGKVYIPFTNIRINPLGVYAPWIKFMARQVSGQRIKRGEVVNLRDWGLFMADEEQKAKPVPYKGGQVEDQIQFVKTKIHPFISLGWNLVNGTDFGGNERPWQFLLAEGLLPLAPMQAIENYMRLPPAQATAESAMELIGITTEPNYDSPEYKKFEAKKSAVQEIIAQRLRFEETDDIPMGELVEAKYRAEAAKMLRYATDPSAPSGSRQEAKMMINDIGLADAIWLLEQQVRKERQDRYDAEDLARKRKGLGKKYREYEPIHKYTADGALTPFGKRVKRLEQIDAE